MRFKEFVIETPQLLDEVVMSPSNLRKLAAQTNALAGMEFEMIVPDIAIEDEDVDQERDYDQDERVVDFADIYNFFAGEYNSSSAVRRVIRDLENEYQEWAEEQIVEQWNSEGRDEFNEYVEDYFDEEDAIETAMEELEITDPDDEKVQKRVEELKEEWLDSEWEDQGRLYNRAYDSWRESVEEPSETDWLRDQGINSMQDVESQYDLIWPHWTSPQGDMELDVKTVANEFSTAIGRKVEYSTTYHGAERKPDQYVIEPDSSLDPDESNDGGLEFVSPPLPIDAMLIDLNKIVAWAKDKGCYTNESTGLHMNVSVPNFSIEKLDYVKLALLLGDEYVLDQYNRMGNAYAKSAAQKIGTFISNNPARVGEVLDKMKSGLSVLASKLIHTGMTDKYTSINTHDGYVEFRSPGGNWLDEDISKLENTLLRFVVALDAACDPNKFRKDYLKKLYVLLQPKSNNDILAYFANYAAGELPKAQLISLIRTAQEKRKGITQPEVAPTNTAGAGNQRYEVYLVSDPNTSLGTFIARANDQESARLGFNSFLTRIGRSSPAGFGYRVIT